MATRAFNKIRDPATEKQGRAIYVSWAANLHNAVVNDWVKEFENKLRPIDLDDTGRTVTTLFNDNINAGVVVDVYLRELRAKATDVVIVLTPRYITEQQENIRSNKVSELCEFLEKKANDVSNTLRLWLAPLEDVKLHRYSVDKQRLNDVAWWHWLKEERFVLPGEPIPQFIDDINHALDVFLAHEIENCRTCGSAATIR